MITYTYEAFSQVDQKYAMQTIFMLLKLFECVQDEQERVLITQSVFYVATKSPQLLTDRTYNLQILQKCFQTIHQYSGFDELI